MTGQTDIEVPAWMQEIQRTPQTGCPVEDYLRMEIAMRKGHGRIDPARPYWGFGDFVLDQGERAVSAPLTPEELAVVAAAVVQGTRLARRLGQPFLALKGCYFNAALLVEGDESETLRYVEGYANSGLLSVLHAWVAINGKTVDLTWGPQRNGHVPETRGGRLNLEWVEEGGWQARVLGVIPQGWAYYGIDLTDEHREAASFGGPLIDNYEAEWPLLGRPRKDPSR